MSGSQEVDMQLQKVMADANRGRRGLGLSRTLYVQFRWSRQPDPTQKLGAWQPGRQSLGWCGALWA